MKRWHITTAVILGSTVLATVAIQASDVLQGVRGNMLGSAVQSNLPCGVGAVQLNFGNGPLCVDVYEVSPGSECPANNIANPQQTQENLNNKACQGVSVAEAMPWKFVSQIQAKQLCARSGKRLPTAKEWFAFSLALQDEEACVLRASAASLTGSTACMTESGIYDLVGNVWEWVDEEVIDGTYGERRLPVAGYVASVDSDGVVVTTDAGSSEEYGKDYAVTDPEGVYGMIRGGFYDSREDGGIFAQNLAVPLDLKTNGIGFRCVKSL